MTTTERKRTYEIEIQTNPPAMPCKLCGAMIIFQIMPSGRRMPIAVRTIEERDGKRYGLPHFGDCPPYQEQQKQKQKGGGA